VLYHQLAKPRTVLLCLRVLGWGNSCLLCLQILPSFQPVALFACAKFTPIGIFAGLWDGIELENTPA
jgi:hypothetical protein